MVKTAVSALGAASSSPPVQATESVPSTASTSKVATRYSRPSSLINESAWTWNVYEYSLVGTVTHDGA